MVEARGGGVVAAGLWLTVGGGGSSGGGGEGGGFGGGTYSGVHTSGVLQASRENKKTAPSAFLVPLCPRTRINTAVIERPAQRCFGAPRGASWAPIKAAGGRGKGRGPWATAMRRSYRHRKQRQIPRSRA